MTHEPRAVLYSVKWIFPCLLKGDINISLNARVQKYIWIPLNFGELWHIANESANYLLHSF